MLSAVALAPCAARPPLPPRGSPTHAELHALTRPTRRSVSLVGPMKVPTQSVMRTTSVNMKDIVLADKALETKINAIVNAEDGRTKSAAMCSQISAANMERLRQDEEDGGCNAFGPPLTQATGLGWDTSTEAKGYDGLKEIAIKLNPTVGMWDPLNIAAEDVSPETIGWFRHAEIKHGRVAMAGFVGYVIQENGIHFPWNIQGPVPGTDLTANLPAISFGEISAAGSPADQWDALPTAAKVQILCVVGFLEMYGETSVALELDGQKHYVRGGKPGYYPSFQNRFPHPVPLDLWDPFGFTKKLSEERKQQGLIAEVNNGRLAMIGIFSLISASKGLQVPALNVISLKQYGGEYMAPFTAADVSLPFVNDMMGFVGNLGYQL